MNKTDHRLHRLFQAAAQAPDQLPVEAPFPLELSVMAAFRNPPFQDPVIPLLPLFRRALVCAGAIIIITAAFSLRPLDQTSSNEMADVDSAIQLTLLQ